MTDLKDRILDVVIHQPMLCGFATTTLAGKPWVRYVVAEARDDLTFRFTSFKTARKVEQLARDAEGHLTCGIPDPSKFHLPYLQIQGRAVFTTDAAEREGFWSDRLKVLFTGPDDPRYGVVVLTAYRIEYTRVGQPVEVWTRDDEVHDHPTPTDPTGAWHEAHS
jgi:general stress protein 26